MSIVIIAALAALAGFLAIRLFAAVTDNTALRAHVAALKRRLRQG
jgi:hypothetical protein